jgi:hypothetical protein
MAVTVIMTTVTVADMRVTLAQVMDDPDGITSHGVVQVECRIEEADGTGA